MNRLQLAHLPLRTKLIAASALTASIALFIAALTQGISSYFFSHNEAYQHLDSVTRIIAGRSATAIRNQDFGQAEALVSALRVEPNVEEALLIDSDAARAHALRGQPHAVDEVSQWRPERAAGMAEAGDRRAATTSTASMASVRCTWSTRSPTRAA